MDDFQMQNMLNTRLIAIEQKLDEILKHLKKQVDYSGQIGEAIDLLVNTISTDKNVG